MSVIHTYHDRGHSSQGAVAASIRNRDLAWSFDALSAPAEAVENAAVIAAG